MSYSESNGQVVLTMSKEDYSRLLVALEFALADPITRERTIELLNRLNCGKPDYAPYQMEFDELADSEAQRIADDFGVPVDYTPHQAEKKP